MQESTVFPGLKQIEKINITAGCRLLAGKLTPCLTCRFFFKKGGQEEGAAVYGVVLACSECIRCSFSCTEHLVRMKGELKPAPLSAIP